MWWPAGADGHGKTTLVSAVARYLSFGCGEQPTFALCQSYRFRGGGPPGTDHSPPRPCIEHTSELLNLGWDELETRLP